MRWKKKKRESPTPGDWKTITIFLFLPMCLKGEWRWLETANLRAMVVGDEGARKERYTPMYWKD